jgi:hypothetical protein
MRAVGPIDYLQGLGVRDHFCLARAASSREPASTSHVAAPKTRPTARSGACSSDTSHANSTER